MSDKPERGGTGFGETASWGPRERATLIAAEKAARAAGEAARKWWAPLQSSAEAVTSDVTLDEFLRDALGAIRSALGADSASLLVVNEAGDELVARASVGLTDDVSLGVGIGSGAGIAGRVMVAREARIVDDLTAVELASPDLRERGLRSMVAVPVLIGDAVLGVLHAASFEVSHFVAADADALELVADRLASPIERVRLFESERAARARAELAADRLGRLQRITVGLSGELEPDRVAELVLGEISPNIKAGLLSSTLWFVEGSRLKLAKSATVSSTALSFSDMSLDDDLPGPDTVRTGKPVWLRTAEERNARYPALEGVTTLGAGIAVLPLPTKGGILGVLAFGFADPQGFDREHRDFLVAVAEQAAQAFERAHLRNMESRSAADSAFLADTSAVLASSLDYHETLARVVRLLVPRLADLATIHLRGGDGVLVRAAVAHRDVEVEKAILAEGRDESDRVMNRALDSFVKGHTIIVDDAQQFIGEYVSANPKLAAALAPLDISSVIVVPLVVRDETLGVLSLVKVGGSATFDAPERRLAEEVGRRASVAIENARLHSAMRAAAESEAFILGVAKVLAQAKGYRETLQQLGAAAVPTLGDLCMIDLLDEEGRLRRLVAHHADPARQPLVDRLRGYQPDIGSSHPSAAVIRQGRSMWAREMPDEFLLATCRDHDHFELVKSLEFSSYMAVPLTVGPDVLGSLTVVSTGSGRRFGPTDLALAEELAGYVAAVVDKARRYEEQHRIAQILESSLLPTHLPDVHGARLAARYQAGTRGVEAGGDFYDVVDLKSGALWLMIGDVAGHDREAAAMMGHLRSVARALVGQVRRPSSLISALQRSWGVLEFDRIATALFCRLDPLTGELLMASAGHPAPLLVSGSGARFVPVEPAPPFGGPRSRPQEWRGTLPRGDLLLLYTDGVIQDRERQLSVDEGMSQLAKVTSSCPREPGAVCDIVLATLGADRSDDVALLSVLLQPGGT